MCLDAARCVGLLLPHVLLSLPLLLLLLLLLPLLGLVTASFLLCWLLEGWTSQRHLLPLPSPLHPLLLLHLRWLRRVLALAQRSWLSCSPLPNLSTALLLLLLLSLLRPHPLLLLRLYLLRSHA